MSKQDADEANEVLLLSRVAYVVERAGLAVAGAMCGTFVAAQLTRINPVRFDSIGFIAAMILVGLIGFYLGVDIPRLRASPASPATARRRLSVAIRGLDRRGRLRCATLRLRTAKDAEQRKCHLPGWRRRRLRD